MGTTHHIQQLSVLDSAMPLQYGSNNLTPQDMFVIASSLCTARAEYFEIFHEVQNRIGEVATEVWDVVERRQEGGLRRLRNFLDQFRAPGAENEEFCLTALAHHGQTVRTLTVSPRCFRTAEAAEARRP